MSASHAIALAFLMIGAAGLSACGQAKKFGGIVDNGDRDDEPVALEANRLDQTFQVLSTFYVSAPGDWARIEGTEHTEQTVLASDTERVVFETSSTSCTGESERTAREITITWCSDTETILVK